MVDVDRAKFLAWGSGQGAGNQPTFPFPALTSSKEACTQAPRHQPQPPVGKGVLGEKIHTIYSH